jgi:glycosyltransferase involved in cell wall biosynthesis
LGAHLATPTVDDDVPRTANAPADVPDFYIVSMRKKEASTGLGRHKTLMGLYEGLPAIGCNPVWLSVTRPRNRFLGLAIAATRWLAAPLVRGRVLPLQSLLALQGGLDPPPPSSRAQPIIYVDGLRLGFLGPGLRRRLNGRLIIDFDDLMSRRLRGMSRRRSALSFGAFSDMLPKAVRWFVDAAKPLQRRLIKLETRLVRRAEVRAAREADAIAFSSAHEARLFSRYLRRFAPGVRPRVLVLGPSLAAPAATPEEIRLRPAPQSIRFVLLGSDTLEQNRVAVQGVLALAEAGALPAPAHIYGKMVHAYEAPPGVTFHGFAARLEDVYQPGSIMLIPRSIAGGVKSKILEAFEHGVPTIAAAAAVEGFDGRYPWKADEADIATLLADCEALKAQYNEALALGVELCIRQFSAQRYWGELKRYATLASA